MFLAAALIIGGIIVSSGLAKKFWSKLQNFIKKVYEKLKVRIRGFLMGSAVFLKKIGNKFQNRTKHYSKDELGKWKETIVTYEQNEDEVPEKYRNYATMDEEFDVTSDFEMELKNA